MQQFDEIRIPEIEEKTGQKWKLAAGIAAGCIIIAAVSLFFLIRFFHSEEKALYRGLKNLADEIVERQALWEEETGMTLAEGPGAVAVDTVLNFSGEELPFTLGIDSQMQRDPDAKKLYACTQLSVMNNDLAEIAVYGEGETIIVSLPDFFRQNLEFETERIDRQYNNSLLAEKFGRIEGEEISFELFPDQTSSWQERTGITRNIIDGLLQSGKKSEEPELEAIVIEEEEEPVKIRIPEKEEQEYECIRYHVTIPKDTIAAFAPETGVEISEDVVLLIAVEEDTERIIQISLEEAVPVIGLIEGSDEPVWLEGTICFLGEARSIDDIVLELECRISLKELLKVEGVLSYFDRIHPIDIGDVQLRLKAELCYEEEDVCTTIQPCSLTVKAGSLGEYKIAGKMSVEPLRKEIRPPEGDTIRIFEITEGEYKDLERQIWKKMQKWVAGYSFLH